MPQAERLLALAGRLQARAQPLRPPELHPFVVAGHTVGWAAPEVARFLVTRTTGFEQRSGMLHLVDEGLSVAHRSALLADAALLLRDAGLLRGWRDEALAVRAHPGGVVLATVERAACRALGIMTEAVHLNAFGDDGTLLVARRAAHKAIDPGLWDNLVGGMVPAGENLEQALEREAWEEAGLRTRPARGAPRPQLSRSPAGCRGISVRAHLCVRGDAVGRHDVQQPGRRGRRDRAAVASRDRRRDRA